MENDGKMLDGNDAGPPEPTLESMAARLADRSLDWNELDFVGWKEFRRMAPAVVGLELARIERLMAQYGPERPEYNTFVRARHELGCFGEGLASAEKESLMMRSEHLRRALLAVSLLAGEIESETLRYTAHRLSYVHDRLQLIY